MTDLFDISGKTAIVTGGATGIGAMITEGLVRSGCRVFIASRKRDVLEAFTTEMDAIAPGAVQFFVADLSTGEGTAALVDDLLLQREVERPLQGGASPALHPAAARGGPRGQGCGHETVFRRCVRCLEGAGP